MGLVDFAIRRRVTIAMATVAITLLGMISLSRLKVKQLPDLSDPTLTIRTRLPGAERVKRFMRRTRVADAPQASPESA
jgi:HAE1 family hydrophobic/amphiphilic exporter-1